MPWLYGAALVSNAGRIAGRRHWFSDTVAGALLGYGIGTALWSAERRRWSAGHTRIGLGADGIEISTRF
jgi:membrane-associated phospholipid phosphatase